MSAPAISPSGSSSKAAAGRPLYEQVKHHVIAQIESGHWATSALIPSEHELVRQLGASRMTVNRALRELTQAGYLTRIQGVGTFVADHRAHAHPLTIRSIAEEIRARGRVHSSRVVRLETVRAASEMAQHFGLPPASTLFHSVIVHLEDERPLQLEDRYVNPAVAPGYLHYDFTTLTAHDHLIAIAPLQEVEHVVQAGMPDATVRRLLEMDGEPCLIVRRRTWTRGSVASIATLSHPGSRFDLRGRFQP